MEVENVEQRPETVQITDELLKELVANLPEGVLENIFSYSVDEGCYYDRDIENLLGLVEEDISSSYEDEDYDRVGNMGKKKKSIELGTTHSRNFLYDEVKNILKYIQETDSIDVSVERIKKGQCFVLEDDYPVDLENHKDIDIAFQRDGDTVKIPESGIFVKLDGGEWQFMKGEYIWEATEPEEVLRENVALNVIE